MKTKCTHCGYYYDKSSRIINCPSCYDDDGKPLTNSVAYGLPFDFGGAIDFSGPFNSNQSSSSSDSYSGGGGEFGGGGASGSWDGGSGDCGGGSCGD